MFTLNRKTRTMAVAAVTVAATGAPVAMAGPLDTSWLPEDVSWVVHVDFEAILDSSLGDMINENLSEITQQMHAGNEQFSLDAGKDLFGVTVYGVERASDEPIAILYASSAIDDVLDALKAEAPGWSEVKTDEGYYMQSWSWDDMGAGDGRMFLFQGARDDLNVIIVGEDLDDVTSAVNVIKGKKQSYSTVDNHDLTIKPGHGSMVYANVSSLGDVPHWGHGGPEITQFAKSAVIELREDDDTMELDVRVRTDDTEMAREMSDVVNGMLALGRLMGNQEKELRDLMELARGLRLDVDGDILHLQFRCDTDTLMDLVNDRHAGWRESEDGLAEPPPSRTRRKNDI